jgi:hypothetical protein
MDPRFRADGVEQMRPLVAEKPFVDVIALTRVDQGVDQNADWDFAAWAQVVAEVAHGEGAQVVSEDFVTFATPCLLVHNKNMNTTHSNESWPTIQRKQSCFVEVRSSE